MSYMMIAYFSIGIVITTIVIASNWHDKDEGFWMRICCIPLIFAWPAFIITALIMVLVLLFVE